MFEDWREFFTCLLLPFCLHLSHNGLNIPTYVPLFLFLPCRPHTHLTGQVKRGEEKQEATASLRAEAPLLWSSTADVIIDSTSLPPPSPTQLQKTSRVISLNSNCANLSDLYLHSSKKKKGPKDPKYLFVSQSSTGPPHLNPNEEFHYQGMKRLSSATCLCPIWSLLSKRGWGWARVPRLCQAHSF